MNEARGRGTHADPGELLAWIDGELTERRAVELRRHLSGCRECESRRRELEASSDALGRELRSADVVPEAASATAIRRLSLRRRVRAVAAAAGLVLVFGGTAAALVPGSPVRAWVDGFRGHAPARAELAAAPRLVTQLSVVAPDSIDISIGEPRHSLRLELVRSSGRRIQVQTRGEEPLGGLELGSGHLQLDPGPARLLRVRFPRRDRVRILARGRDLLSPETRRESSAPADSVTVVTLSPAGPDGTP